MQRKKALLFCAGKTQSFLRSRRLARRRPTVSEASALESEFSGGSACAREFKIFDFKWKNNVFPNASLVDLERGEK
jgi:hypothetical protein